MSQTPAWLQPIVEACEQRHLHRFLTGSLHGHARLDAPPKAAVLALFSGDPTASVLPDDAALVLTHRSAQLRAHAGQVSFPGGRIDAGESPLECALRETEEEVGIDRRRVSALAVADSIPVRSTSYPVAPVVGYWPTPYPLAVTNHDETTAVLQVPVRELLDADKRMIVTAGSYHGPGYAVGGYLVWGFTAHVLQALLRAGGYETATDLPRVPLEEAIGRSRNEEIPPRLR